MSAEPETFVFATDRSTLQRAVTWAARAVNARPYAPVLGGMLVEVADAQATFSGFDGDTTNSANCSIADGWTPGRTLVSGRLLASIVAQLPSAPVAISCDEQTMTIQAGTTVATLATMPIEDYPPLPAIAAQAGRIDGLTFARQLARVVHACADDGLPVLHGVHMSATNTGIQLAATDRYRIAVADCAEWEPMLGRELPPMLLPADVANSITRMDTAGLLDIGGNGSVGAFTTPDQTVTGRMLDESDKFPDLSRMAAGGTFPAASDHPSGADRDELAAAVKGAAVCVTAGPILLEWAHNGLTVSGVNGGDGFSSTVECTHSGDTMALAFNPKFLTDALSACGPGPVEFHMTGPWKPTLVTPASDETYREVIMPVRRSG